MRSSTFFPDAVAASERRKTEAAAKKVCSTCPVVLPCLRDALSRGEQDGVWGGLTTAERAALGTRVHLVDAAALVRRTGTETPRAATAGAARA
jgi:WhiB family redox-sensing transcriptional regulator